MNGFQASREWRIYEIKAQRRWNKNDRIAYALHCIIKGTFVPVIIAALCWLLVHTLIATYYIVMYAFTYWR